VNAVEIHNIKEHIKVLKEQLATATEKDLRRQLEANIRYYEEQLRQAEIAY
jgi:hypothetical protein